MNLYYTSNRPNKKTHKLNYISPNLLRLTYLIKLNPVHHFSEKKVYNRSSKIPKVCLGDRVSIHTGKSFRSKNVNRWMVGFRFGEFTLTRKRALYKSKKKEKEIKFEHILQIY